MAASLDSLGGTRDDLGDSLVTGEIFSDEGDVALSASLRGADNSRPTT